MGVAPFLWRHRFRVALTLFIACSLALVFHAGWVVLWIVASSVVWHRLFLMWRRTGGAWLLRLEDRLDARYR